ncbi:CUB and sushi domain-containing protein 3-like isoform X2 [Lineus longissimus]|uniref:CUB and sushi domain-containing protein 3-like isoform X2 n=1 Tax=Lineus longissimus TaxID=88925 RepID=UPI00315D57DA
MVKYSRLGVFILILIQISGCLLQDLGDDDFGSLEDGGGDDLVEKPLGKCPPVPSPPHAVLVSTPKDTSISSTVKMKCGRGYRKIGGSTTRACQPTLKWGGKDIICKALECKNLVIKNAVANTTARTFGTVVGFSCRNGTSRPSAEGDAARRCRANQLWSGNDITCLPPKCPKLELPQSTIASTKKRSVGVVVKLSCARGMVNVTGDQQVTCGEDQKWKGKTLKCQTPQCKPLKVVSHGTKDKENRNAGAVVKLTCKKGYKGSGNDITLCDKKTLNWTKSNFKCIRSEKSKKKSRKHKTGKHKTRKGRKGRKGKEKKPRCSTFTGATLHGVRSSGSRHRALTMQCYSGWVRSSGEKKIFCKKQGDELRVWSGEPLVCKPGGDVAKGKPMYQSSNTGPLAKYNGCFITTGKDAPWWYVDLKVEYPIARITLYKYSHGKINRKLARSLKDFTISVTNTIPGKGTYKANKKEVCLHVRKSNRRSMVSYKCKSVKVGRYLVISMEKKFKLGICTIRVWPKRSIATLKHASQSSTFGNYSARLAIDGNLASDPESNSCSLTSYQNNPWWVVDLKGRKIVSRVILYHKSDRTVTEQLANFSLSVTGRKPSGEAYMPAEKEVCYTQKEVVVLGSVTSIRCKSPKKGRFIVVSRAGVGVMSLCEVLVY